MAKIFKRVSKKDNLLDATFADINAYNKSVGKHRRINITKAQINSYSDVQLKSLRRSLSNIVNKNDGKKRGKESIASKTREYVQNKNPDSPTYLQNLYYQNFMRAAVKTGNKEAFRMGLKMGPVWIAKQIKDSAFEIYDLYNEDENETYQIDRLDDDEITAMGFDFDNPNSFKFGRYFRSSEHANKVNKLNKHVFDLAKIRIKK